jgi:hypothetical protein
MVRFVLNQTTERDFLNFWRAHSRLDRSVGLVNDVEEVAPSVFLVRSQKDPAVRYTVDLAHRTCECSDWTYRGSVNGIPCKHIMAAYLAAHRKPAGESAL